MGPQHVRDGRLRVVQQKTRAQSVQHSGSIPNLAAIIEASGRRDTWRSSITAQGKPFTAAGFGNWFREACNAAGSAAAVAAHGLRKGRGAAAWRDAGATPHEIAAVTGHESLREVERYCRGGEPKTRLANVGSSQGYRSVPPDEG